MENNIYSTPDSELIQDNNSGGELASRWNRLFASLLDSLILLCITVPLMYFTGGFEGIAEGVQPSIGYSLFLAVIGIIAFVLINGKLLVSNGPQVTIQH